MLDPLTISAQTESIENRYRPVLEMTRVERDQLYDKLQRMFAGMPHRFVANEAGRPRPERVQVRIEDGQLMAEVWEPVLHVYAKEEAVDAIPRLDGWNVYRFLNHADIARHSTCDCVGTRRVQLVDGKSVHKDCGRVIPRTKTDAELIESIKTMHLQVDTDLLYEGFYPGIPGNDVIRFDKERLMASKHTDSDRKKMEAWRGNDVMLSKADDPKLKGQAVVAGKKVMPTYKGPSQVMRGGTYIKNRQHWREKTKDMVLWDEGVHKNWDDVRKHREAQQHERLVDLCGKYRVNEAIDTILEHGDKGQT